MGDAGTIIRWTPAVRLCLSICVRAHSLLGSREPPEADQQRVPPVCCHLCPPPAFFLHMKPHTTRALVLLGRTWSTQSAPRAPHFSKRRCPCLMLKVRQCVFVCGPEAAEGRSRQQQLVVKSVWISASSFFFHDLCVTWGGGNDFLVARPCRPTRVCAHQTPWRCL